MNDVFKEIAAEHRRRRTRKPLVVLLILLGFSLYGCVSGLLLVTCFDMIRRGNVVGFIAGLLALFTVARVIVEDAFAIVARLQKWEGE